LPLKGHAPIARDASSLASRTSIGFGAIAAASNRQSNVGIRNSKAARARRKRGQYRRTLTIPGAQLRRLAELGCLERVDDPVAQVSALEAFLFDSLQ
jgi:hypothetical protein